ncbi:hypothetical protein CPB84DRAFT_1743596 [Gymnopilus junonius]|uniref:F-box domain-containing protein n=1 Tax=Gymnopilus junonius TaxID=109634 RepID=A0A9P5TTR6_GYMJU|nr:hypothetical protein CPB84DRAFT_1743596 [Gymnopilus junonius]
MQSVKIPIFDQLNKQILETKAHLDALLDERQKLKWELNYMHKSMVDRMPVEVASTIFEFYAVATRNYWNIAAGGYGMALTLGAVCQSWRRIVWSTPSVWNWITVVLDGTVNPVVIELAVEWLGRSGRLPLSIELFGPSSPSDLEPQLPVVLPLIHAVNECSDRWDNLTLHLPSSFLSYFHDTRGGSETMSCLEVWTGPTSVTMNIRSITPKKVHIICLELNDSLLDWNRTSILSMSDSYTIYECVEVMRQAPQLRRCTFSKVDSGTPELLLNMSVYATRRPLEKVLMILYNRDEQDPFISPPTLREISYLQSQGMEFEIITYLDNKAKDFLQLSLERHSGERSAD